MFKDAIYDDCKSHRQRGCLMPDLIKCLAPLKLIFVNRALEANGNMARKNTVKCFAEF